MRQGKGNEEKDNKDLDVFVLGVLKLVSLMSLLSFCPYFINLNYWEQIMNSCPNLHVILLAGGTGSRMNASVPKQFIQLKGKPIILYSFELFISLPQVKTIVVVCEKSYRELFQLPSNHKKNLAFANPGIRRQDSVEQGFNALEDCGQLVCIHDGARPFLTADIVERTAESAAKHGAAAAAMPVKFTIKECDQKNMVVHTPDRSKFWEVQTPQTIRYDLLKKGLKHASENALNVTDDVSLIEALGLPVQLVPGDYRNLKITTPEDLLIAENLAILH